MNQLRSLTCEASGSKLASLALTPPPLAPLPLPHRSLCSAPPHLDVGSKTAASEVGLKVVASEVGLKRPQLGALKY